MFESSAIKTDPFDGALGMARFIRGIVKGILERRRTDIDYENLFRPLTFEHQPVRIIALAKRGLGFRRIRQQHSCSIGNRAGNVPYRAGLGHNDGLKERHRNEQDFAMRCGDEIRQQWITCQQCGFGERVARVQLSERLARAVVQSRGRYCPAQHNSEISSFCPLVGDRFVRFEGSDLRAFDQLVEPLRRKVSKYPHSFLEKTGWIQHKRTRRLNLVIAGERRYWTLGLSES